MPHEVKRSSSDGDGRRTEHRPGLSVSTGRRPRRARILTLGFWVYLLAINVLTGPTGEEVGWR
jgi:hypothetical protein